MPFASRWTTSAAAALDGCPIDLYLVHAPDPRTPWRTTVRALARILHEGLARRVGISNVNRRQLDEALALVPLAAIQVGLSALDDRAVRGGLVERCEEAAARLQLTDADRETLGRALGRGREARPQSVARVPGDVVLVMGIPGAGKSRVAASYVARSYERLNRDERGGRLRDLATALEDALGAGRREVVLDNTYLDRETRSHVVDAAARHGVRVRSTAHRQLAVALGARLVTP